MRVFGWADAKMVQRDSTLTTTRARLHHNIWPYWKMDAMDKVGPILSEDSIVAEAVIMWLDETFVKKVGGSEFDHNVRAAIEVDSDGYRYVRAKNMGYLAWAINGYAVDREKRMAKAAALVSNAVSQFVGTVSVRDDFELVLEFRRTFASEFGQKALCKFKDAAGNIMIWWGTGDVAFDMIVGNTYTLRATVKGHEVYEGINQTAITRATVLQGAMKEAARC